MQLVKEDGQTEEIPADVQEESSNDDVETVSENSENQEATM